MTQSFWLDSAAAPRPPLEANRTAEALIVGAGLTGISLALALAPLKAETVVLESDRVAGEATGRGTGMITGGLGEHYVRSVSFWGRDDAASIYRLHRRNHDEIVRTLAEHPVDCGYRRRGSFRIASDEAEERIIRESHVLLRQDGFPVELMESGELNRSLGSRGFLGGTYHPDDAELDPVRLVRGLAAHAERLGVRIHEGTPVVSLTRERDLWLARTPRGSVETPRLFLAANAWVPRLLPGIPVTPVRGQCLATGPARLATPLVPCLSRYASEYWRAANDQAIFGGMRRAAAERERGYEDAVSEPVQEALLQFRDRHFPNLGGAPVTHRWSGVMAYTADGLPLIGGVAGSPGMFLSAGYTGQGFGYTFVAARWLVDLAFHGNDGIPPFVRTERELRASPALEEL